MEVAPALGCTEPAAVALGAAAAASLLDTQTISHIELWVDAHVYKNGMAVSLPGAPDLVGLDTASALGAICGDPHLRLEVLEPVGAPAIAAARQLLKTGAVRVNLLAQQDGPFVRTVITSGNDNAEAIVSGSHDNIVYLAKNGQPVTDSPLLSAQDQNAGVSRLTELEGWLKELSLPELVGLVDRIDTADIAFLQEGVRLNTELAEYGLKHNCGMGVGKAMERLVRQRLIKKDMILAAKMLTSAASDARMAGIKLPAMSSAGSGNHGLTAILPIWAVKDYIECEERTVYEAIALSHVITGFVKAYTGRLSALCGCSSAAGAGATAGITYLLGGGLQHIAGAIKNLSEDLAGVICDGAKAGCSLKLATAAGSAVQASLFALQGVQVQFTDGIIERSPEKTMQNIGTLSTEGSLDMDRAILRIMMEKEFSG
jgi:L-cysteine desulfidase